MFIKRLKALREEKGFSQAKLAELINITQQAVGKWETGKSTPDPEMIVKLANLFNVSADYLLGRQVNTDKSSNLTLDAATQELINVFSSLNDDGRNKVLEYAQDISSTKKYMFNKNKETG